MVEDKVVHKHATKAYRGRGGIAPLILTLNQIEGRRSSGTCWNSRGRLFIGLFNFSRREEVKRGHDR